MAESQQAQPETQQAETSPPQASQATPSSPAGVQRLDREAGHKIHADASKRNPFSPENMAKRRAALTALREDRGIAQPSAKEAAAHDEGGKGPSSGDVPSGADESSSKSSDSVPHSAVEQSAQSAKSEPKVSDAQMEWYKREQAVRAAELKAQEAQSTTEKRIAAAEQKEAEAKAALQRLDWARSNPIEFMTEAGMTQDEWKAFLANGGNLSPEQKRTRALEKELAETRAQMAAFEKKQEAWQRQQALQMEVNQFHSVMSNYELVQRMGGIDAVQNKRTFLEQQTGQKVSLNDAADVLEKEYHDGLSRLLQDKAVRSKFKLDVDTSNAGPVAINQPRTLNSKVAPTTPPSTPSARKGPPDWAARKAEYLQRVAQERASSVPR